MLALDLLGRRWTLRILWELRSGPLTFRSMREACDDVSPSVLNTRLAELREAGIVDRGSDGYELTASGRDLGRALAPLQSWADGWAGDRC
jgi:DNA-binding HxlR family transcriptional regulator